MLLDDKKLKELTGIKTPIAESLKTGTDTISQLNKLGATANTFLEKILTFKNMQQPSQEGGQFNAKVQKGIQQQTPKPQKLVINEVTAMTELDGIVQAIPENDMNLKAYREKRDTIKPFVLEFIRRCVKIE